VSQTSASCYEGGFADGMNKAVVVVARDPTVLRVDIAHRLGFGAGTGYYGDGSAEDLEFKRLLRGIERHVAGTGLAFICNSPTAGLLRVDHVMSAPSSCAHADAIVSTSRQGPPIAEASGGSSGLRGICA